MSKEAIEFIEELKTGLDLSQAGIFARLSFPFCAQADSDGRPSRDTQRSQKASIIAVKRLYSGALSDITTLTFADQRTGFLDDVMVITSECRLRGSL